MISLHALRTFLVAQHAKIIHAGTACTPIIAGFAHYEDATSGDISWLRHPIQAPYKGTVLLLSQDCVYTYKPRDPHLFVARASRALIGKIIGRFFARDATLQIDATARIHPTALIGVQAQNYEWQNGQWEPFPAAGNVRVGATVEIGPYATIVRGSASDTIIDKGCRIGQHVNVGHDCRIGAHTLIVAHASLAGWVHVGDRCKIYQSAVIKNGIYIGDDAVIGMGAVVLEDVGPNEVWAGNPARCIRRTT